MKSLNEVYKRTYSEIWFYPKEEAKEIAFLLLQSKWGVTKTDLLVADTDKEYESVEMYVERINQGEPIQYILGEAWFRERKFKVNPAVLIPRPETEELVGNVVYLNPKTVLDLGTGCGCISVSLALELKDSDVYAIDISEAAINVAKENATSNEANVIIEKANILDFENPFEVEKFDLIVSNPPYVKENEKPEMSRNVLDFEPHLALFVSDQDPLVFYRSIGEIGKKHLAENGEMWVEINSYLGQETADIFLSQGYNHVKILKDLSGKDRFLEIKP